MRLSDLVENHLIGDDDWLKVTKPLQGDTADVVRGHWYSDQLLDFHDEEVAELSWSPKLGWTIWLAYQVEAPCCSDDGFIVEKKFSKELMEKSGLIRYVNPTGGTRISIEYDADTGEGRLTANADNSIQTDLTDSQ